MRTDRDYYRVLGVERQATPEQIKQRYRELVRQHHPDVNPNQHAGLGHNTFLQIVEAYQILSDVEKRREYDRVWERRAPPGGSPDPAAHAAPAGGAVIATLLADARRYLESRAYSDAARACRRVVQLDKENAAAYDMLGDIYAALKRPEEAISYYTMAQQFAGAARPEITVKIDRLMKREEQKLHEAIHGKPVYKQAPLMAVLVVSLVMLGCWASAFRESQPIEGFALFDQTSFQVLVMFWIDAFLLGAVMAGTGLIARFDDEMLFTLGTQDVSGNAPPLGLLVPVLSILNFYLAVAAFLLYSLMHERFSVSLVKAALGLLALAVLFALPHLNSLEQILLYGTGPGFAIMCGGWLISDVIRPHW